MLAFFQFSTGISLCLFNYFFSTSTKKKDQELVIAAFPWHEVFMFLNQQFLGALQVEYQNKTKSPFETHPIHMWTFLTSICFYSVILAFKINIKACSNDHFAFILKHVLLVLGSLSSASLLCIFQPGQHFWFLYVIGIYMPLMLAHHLLQNQVLKVLGTIMTSASQLRDYLNMFCGCIGQWRYSYFLNIRNALFDCW